MALAFCVLYYLLLVSDYKKEQINVLSNKRTSCRNVLPSSQTVILQSICINKSQLQLLQPLQINEKPDNGISMRHLLPQTLTFTHIIPQNNKPQNVLTSCKKYMKLEESYY